MKFLIRFKGRSPSAKYGQRTVDSASKEDALRWFNKIEKPFIPGNVYIVSIKRK